MRYVVELNARGVLTDAHVRLAIDAVGSAICESSRGRQGHNYEVRHSQIYSGRFIDVDANPPLDASELRAIRARVVTIPELTARFYKEIEF